VPLNFTLTAFVSYGHVSAGDSGKSRFSSNISGARSPNEGHSSFTSGAHRELLIAQRAELLALSLASMNVMVESSTYFPRPAGAGPAALALD
jgi:hypothetical protein